MASILDAPLSLYSIPVAWLLAYIPQVIKVTTASKFTTYDNLDPRTNVSKISAKDKVDDRLKAKVARADAAHQNGLESFPVWSIAVLVANYAGLASRSINNTALVYLGSRVVYNYIYINQSKQWHGSSRTLVWNVGVGAALSLLIRSANLVSSRT
ncbi:hypothetical protein FA13DRAFT_1812157 [Coprinellus micaceus]|uniref:Membrane-associated proteins in eicosanoid and glutathione metabolism n=1 Tax=Coprinellus micaceus TaxID=71717 RepID=A0A4Y7TJ45_COPMI|nr:hypothetical protein FA13DRAFT_1812157 [Coprinellus micaceus]